MTPKELEAVGKRLYGERWKTPLANAVGVDRVTVARWAKGGHTIPPYVDLAIEALKRRAVEALSK